MVNKKDLRGGAEKMREVAQLLSAWADDLEASGERRGEPLSTASGGNIERGEVSRNKRSVRRTVAPIEAADRKKAVEPAEAVASADVAVQDAEPAEETVPAVVAASVEEPAAAAEIGYEDLRGLLAEKSAAGYRTQVIALIHSFGAEKLSGVDPAHFGELRDAAAGLGGDGDA